MHGAALTYGLYLPAHGGVLELWPKDRDMWRCFEHLTTMAGLHYARWENRNPGDFRIDERGDYTTVNIAEFMKLFKEAIDVVSRKRGVLPIRDVMVS
jgi:hypothetical protein